MSGRKCSIEGCGRPHDMGGLCPTHLARLRRTGSAQADVPVAVAGATPDNVGWQAKPGAAASKIAAALTKAGYIAAAADHGLAVRVYDGVGNQVGIVWLPMSEEEGKPLPSSWLSGVYLWGRTGDEHQAPDSTELPDLVEQIVRTLS